MVRRDQNELSADDRNVSVKRMEKLKEELKI
jgi:hypothetical protein